MPDVLAYFITFTRYGTRLHGDPRGSVDREHNAFDSEHLAANEPRASFERSRLVVEPTLLGPIERTIVESAIQDVCVFRSWALHALNVRTNHVHVVVSAADPPERVMNAFKSYATRALRRADPRHMGPQWTHHGSTRYLWTERDVLDASTYVLDGQGPDI